MGWWKAIRSASIAGTLDNLPQLLWQVGAEPSGTRIEGYLDLAPPARLSLPYSLALILGLWVTGIVLNLCDLTAATHFTKDPEVDLVLSALSVPLTIGFYLVARKLGSRPDKSLLEFLELTLAATRIG